MIKKPFIVFFALSISITLLANINIKYPRVNRSYSNDMPILEVIFTENSTIVSFMYVGNGYTIALSSKTTLLADDKNTLKIKKWGVRQTDNEYLEFDKWYNTERGRDYVFFMEFPKLTTEVTQLSISENADNGFYWEGIFVKSSNSKHPQYPETSQEQGREKGQSQTNPRSNGNESNDNFVAQGTGTGFSISKDGYIVTNYHVVENAHQLRVRGVNGNFDILYKADVVICDKNNDLALIKINDNRFSSLNDMPPYLLSNLLLDTGDDMFILGYPMRSYMGDEIKLATGVVSSRSGYQGDVTTYQITAQAQPGNSGGPMFDRHGHVVGVVNARMNYVENVSYAIKGSYLMGLINSLEKRPTLPSENKMEGKSLSEQVKLASKFVYSIEIE